MTVGAITVALGLALRMRGVSQWIMWEVAGLFENIGTVHDGKGMLTKPIAILDRPQAGALAVDKGEIVFDHARFHYGRATKVIEDFALTIAPGEKVGVVGRSGAGKSTLVNLLMRFYDLEGGRILIDGQDISHVTQESLRREIGMVTQDTSLLHRSVIDNILYGRPEASREEAIAAAELAHADGFIRDLSDAKGRHGLRRPCRRARRQALRRPAPAHRDRPRLPQERADPRPRRGDQRARFGDRGGDPGIARQPDGRQDGDRHRPPPVDHRGDGPAGGARPRPHRRDRHA